MPNITFDLDEDLLREVRVIAARYDTSLNALVRDYFQHLAQSGLSSDENLNGNLHMLFHYSVGHLTRKEAREALGVNDVRLTQLMRMAGFPPPRSPKAEEDAQVEKAVEFLGPQPHPPSSENAELYQKDFYGWAMRSAELVRQGRFDEIDRDSLAEEIEDMGKSERRELIGFLAQSFANRIKYDYLSGTYPGNSTRWRKEAEGFFKQALEVLEENPSLKMDEIIEDAWEKARDEVFRSFDELNRTSDLDTAGIPSTCPWTPEEVLSDRSFLRRR